MALPHRRFPRLVLVLVGAVLIALSGVGAWLLLHTDSEAAERLPDGQQVALLFPYSDSPYNLDVAIGVRPRLVGDCNPIRVTVRSFHRPPERSRNKPIEFQLLVLGPGPPAREFAIKQPKNEAEHRLVGTRLNPGEFLSEAKATFRLVRAEFDQAINMSFEADWAVRRAAGQCYVRLPALGEYLEARFAGAGTNSVNVKGGSVSRRAEDNLPPPSRQINEAGEPDALWECSFPLSDKQRARRDEPGKDCSALALAINTELEDTKLFWLFLLAALISLGFQLVYDGSKRRSDV